MTIIAALNAMGITLNRSQKSQQGGLQYDRYLLAWVPHAYPCASQRRSSATGFAKHMAELRAHQQSTATGSVILGVVIWLVIRLWPPASQRQAISIGLVWVALTVAFEFGMGRLLML